MAAVFLRGEVVAEDVDAGKRGLRSVLRLEAERLSGDSPPSAAQAGLTPAADAPARANPDAGCSKDS